MHKTTTLATLALAAFVAFGLSSCKSKESLYKKAYEKAQAQNTATTPVAEENSTVNVTPVAPSTTTTTTTAITPSNDNVRVQQESVQVIDGAGLKAYSVVCGSFSLKANAQGLQKTLKDKGYQAQIVLNPERKLYRVVASTHDTKADAITIRTQLRATYPDAWLLYKK